MQVDSPIHASSTEMNVENTLESSALEQEPIQNAFIPETTQLSTEITNPTTSHEPITVTLKRTIQEVDSSATLPSGTNENSIDEAIVHEPVIVDDLSSSPLRSTYAPLVPVSISSVYKSCYNGVPVFEVFIDGYGVMRREKDNFMNATHLLTIAGLSKGQRTKVLDLYTATKTNYERIQGGYGRYQGTWVPMSEARIIAKRYGIQDCLATLFAATEETVNRDPASKKAALAKKSESSIGKDGNAFNAKSEKPERSVNNSPTKKTKVTHKTQSFESDEFSILRDGEMKAMNTKDYTSHKETKAVSAAELPIWEKGGKHQHDSPIYRSLSQIIPLANKSQSLSNLVNQELSAIYSSQQSHKPRRFDFDVINGYIKNFEKLSLEERQTKIIRNICCDGDDRELYALLYFKDASAHSKSSSNFEVDIVLDDHGNTPLHWAAAKGAMNKVHWLVSHQANPLRVNNNGENLLMLAVTSSQSATQKLFGKLLDMFTDAMFNRDKSGRTLFHHIILSFEQLQDSKSSIYYFNTFIEVLNQREEHSFIDLMLSTQENDGNTALHLAYRMRNTKLIERLLDLGCPEDIRNQEGRLAMELD